MPTKAQSKLQIYADSAAEIVVDSVPVEPRKKQADEPLYIKRV